jgi:hypothetical protein
MADVSITAANVLSGPDAEIERGVAGATITAGQAVYLDSADRQYKLADSDSATAAVRGVRGIALNGAADGQPLSIQKGGDITIGGTLVDGETYVLSDTPGGIMPVGDLETGDYPTILGIAKSASVLNIKIVASGVAKA